MSGRTIARSGEKYRQRGVTMATCAGIMATSAYLSTKKKKKASVISAAKAWHRILARVYYRRRNLVYAAVRRRAASLKPRLATVCSTPAARGRGATCCSIARICLPPYRLLPRVSNALCAVTRAFTRWRLRMTRRRAQAQAYTPSAIFSCAPHAARR